MAKRSPDYKPSPNDVYGWAKEGRKNLNDFMVDLFGSLVPGIIFLFSILLCLAIPVTLLFLTSVKGYNEDLIGLLSDIFQNWFWVISFLTFLILAYAIGNIFYRLDIKEVDRRSFDLMARKHFREEVYGKVKKYFKENNRLLNWFSHKLNFNRRMKLSYRMNCTFDSKDSDFIESFQELFYDQFRTFKSDVNRFYKDEEGDKDKVSSHIHLLLGINGKYGKAKNEATDDLLLLKKMNNLAFILHVKRDTDIKYNILDIEEKDLVIDTIDKQKERIRGHLLPFVKGFDKTFASEGEEQKKQLTLALGWYYLFSLRSEFACDKKENCQFPYTYYTEYLIKRDARDLVRHVIWKDKNSRSKNGLNRLKFRVQLAAPKEYNILVKNEAHIRMASSSWRVAKAMFWICGFSVILIAILISIQTGLIRKPSLIEKLTRTEYTLHTDTNPTTLKYDLHYDPVKHTITAESSGEKDINRTGYWHMTSVIILALLPFMVLAFNIFIYSRVTHFIHYQRLREIFTTVLTYHYLFEDGIHKWYEKMECKHVDSDLNRSDHHSSTDSNTYF